MTHLGQRAAFLMMLFVAVGFFPVLYSTNAAQFASLYHDINHRAAFIGVYKRNGGL